MSADRVQDFKRNIPEPQSWNQYAYTINNPLRYIDPDGKQYADPLAYRLYSRAGSQLPFNSEVYIEAYRNSAISGAVGVAGLGAVFLGYQGFLALSSFAASNPGTDAIQRLVNLLHKIELGKDPATKQFSKIEAEVGAQLERIIGRTLQRDPTGIGEWIDKFGTRFDLMGPIPSKFFNLKEFLNSLARHLDKVDRVVVDLRGLEEKQIEEALAAIGKLHAGEQGRIIIFWR